jgi:hypothetical protein
MICFDEEMTEIVVNKVIEFEQVYSKYNEDCSVVSSLIVTTLFYIIC